MLSPTVAVLTALPVEYAAMRAWLDQPQDLTAAPDPADRNHYSLGGTSSRDPGRPHRVVLTMLPQDGTLLASSVTTEMLRSFPSVRCALMCGIAGGVPDPGRPGRHVRLGDVVVGEEGIVDFDHTRTTDGTERLRRYQEGLSADLLRAVRAWQAAPDDWSGSAARAASLVGPFDFSRPDERTDVVHVAGVLAQHPAASADDRVPGVPKVHHGVIGSADRLLRDAARRDQLAAAYGLRAVEMEASGLAAGAWSRAVPWFVVRGIADYCDNATKNDRWHSYAAFVAAAHTTALLRRCPPWVAPVDPGAPWDIRAKPAVLGRVRDPIGVMRLVDLLLQVAEMHNPGFRQAVVDELPSEIRFGIERSGVAGLDVRAVIRRCWQFTEGPEQLVGALRAVVGDTVPVRQFCREALRGNDPAGSAGEGDL